MPQDPLHDPARLAVLAGTGLLDRPPAPGLDRLTRLAARLLGAPVALVTLVTGERQVFAAQLGLAGPWAEAGETPLSHSFCQHVVTDDGPLVVTDARDHERLRDNRAIDEIGVVAYAGMPIRVAGRTIGSFCAIDGQPRDWSADDLAALEDLAGAVASEIALIRAVEAAAERDATTRAVIEMSVDAYVAIDADGLITGWNSAAETLFGWSRDEAIGAPLAAMIIPAEHRAAHRDGLARLRRTGRSQLAGRRVELTALDRAGRRFPVEFRLQPSRLDGIPMYHAFLHDITERRAAEEQLRRSAELIDAAPAAIIVRGLDGTIRFWNHGAEEMYGWSADAALGRNIHRLLRTGFPDSLEAVEKALETDGVWAGELTHRRADGTTVVTLSRHAVRPGPDGDELEVIETGTDITARRRAEDDLAASERQFRVQFSQSTIGQAIVGLDGRIIQANEAYAAMVGQPVHRLAGRTEASLTHPEDRAEATRLIAGLLAGDYDSYERTKRMLHADGRTLDVRVGVRLVRDAENRPLHLIGVVENITAQLLARRELDVAYRALSESNEQLWLANEDLERAMRESDQRNGPVTQ